MTSDLTTQAFKEGQTKPCDYEIRIRLQKLCGRLQTKPRSQDGPEAFLRVFFLRQNPRDRPGTVTRRFGTVPEGSEPSSKIAELEPNPSRDRPGRVRNPAHTKRPYH